MIVTVTAWSLKRLARDSLTKRSGERRDGRERRSGNRGGHLVRPVHHGAARGPSRLFFAEDRLETTIELSTIIPIPRVEPAERHEVERYPPSVHDEKGRDDGKAGIDVAMMILLRNSRRKAKEREREETADKGGVPHFVHRLTDEMRLIEENVIV